MWGTFFISQIWVTNMKWNISVLHTSSVEENHPPTGLLSLAGMCDITEWLPYKNVPLSHEAETSRPRTRLEQEGGLSYSLINHVQRTRAAAQHLPWEVRLSSGFITFFLTWVGFLFKCICFMFVSLSWQGKGVEGFVWEFAAEVRSQHYRTIQEKWESEVSY